MKERHTGKGILLFISIITLCTGIIGKTAAFLITRSNSVENRFQAAAAACVIAQESNEKCIRGIAVKNIGTAPVYLRVRLISHRINEEGEMIGGLSEISEFPLGKNWKKVGNHTYYYRYPVGIQEDRGYPDCTENLIAPGGQIEKQIYQDAEGGKQVIEIMAEAVQSSPKDALKDAWPEEIMDWLSEDIPTEILISPQKEQGERDEKK